LNINREKRVILISIKNVTDDDDLMIINKSGITIRMSVKDLRVMGRATQGVRLIRIDDGDEIAAVAKVDIEPEDEIDVMDENTEMIENESNEDDSLSNDTNNE